MKKVYHTPLKIIVAPNSFKGSLSSIDAADALAEGLKKSGLQADIIKFPIADGGSDTMQVLTELYRGSFIEMHASDPLGRQISCRYGWVSDKELAIIGLSEASGIHLIQSNDVMRANTFGTGQQILDALDRGAKTVVIGIGGSATTDGGTGILRGLGFKFFDDNNNEIEELPEGLLRVRSVDKSAIRPRKNNCKYIVLCDVENPLLGREGAAAVYGPQKGASEEEVEKLERCLARWAEITKDNTGVDISKMKYGGAAGGVSAGLNAWLGAELKSGIDYLLEEFNFDNKMAGADYVFTGEGQIDSQTLKGKGPYSVAMRAKNAGVKTIAFAGSVKERDKLTVFDEIIEINRSKDVRAEMKRTGENLEAAAKEWGFRMIGKSKRE